MTIYLETDLTSMFTVLSKKILRWGTPDPAYDWFMYGHIVNEDGRLVLIDPPVVPNLLENARRLGKIEAIVLTTLDHSRGSGYIVGKTGINLYVPEQTADDVDPSALRLLEEVKDYETYKEGKVAGLTAFSLRTAGKRSIGMPSMNECALLTRDGELMVGDFASVSPTGEIQVAPEWFPSDSKPVPFDEGREIFKEVVQKSGASSLISSHGGYVLGKLQEVAESL